MARNGSGTYSVVNTFVSGNSVTASGHNQNWSDAGTEITNSVAADGQTTMTGPLKAANGTVGAPAVTFASDADSGIYRIGANNVGVAVNGAKVLDIATTGLTVTGTINSVTLDNTAWTVYSPVLTATVGTFTTTTVTGRYKQIGKTVFVQGLILITTVGSASGTALFSLPVTQNTSFDYMGSGRNMTANPFLSVYTIADSKAHIQTYNGLFPGTSGETLLIGLTYEAA